MVKCSPRSSSGIATVTNTGEKWVLESGARPNLNVGCVIAQAFFSREVSAIPLKSRFFQRGLA